MDTNSCAFSGSCGENQVFLTAGLGSAFPALLITPNTFFQIQNCEAVVLRQFFWLCELQSVDFDGVGLLPGAYWKLVELVCLFLINIVIHV